MNYCTIHDDQGKVCEVFMYPIAPYCLYLSFSLSSKNIHNFIRKNELLVRTFKITWRDIYFITYYFFMNVDIIKDDCRQDVLTKSLQIINENIESKSNQTRIMFSKEELSIPNADSVDSPALEVRWTSEYLEFEFGWNYKINTNILNFHDDLDISLIGVISFSAFGNILLFLLRAYLKTPWICVINTS